jgi:hypothetical protein
MFFNYFFDPNNHDAAFVRLQGRQFVTLPVGFII